jgi:hypothetical protein
LAGFTEDIIFLEEDHWVVEDFIHVYRLLKSQSRTWCPECAFISLGNQMKKQDRAGNQVKVRGKLVKLRLVGSVDSTGGSQVTFKKTEMVQALLLWE